MTSSQLEKQTFAGRSPIIAYINLVKLPHTVFALPFALLGVVYASWSTQVEWHQVLLVVAAFTAARFAAMGFNRIVDQRIDALNPRTWNREIPTGRMSLPQAVRAVGAAVVMFFASVALLNRLCLILSPVALAWIWAYSYTKRFTSWSHLWLGAALAIAPVGGFLAITGTWSSPWWTLVVLAGSVATWVGGFDIFYALQDERFDREHGLHSAVVLLGPARSVLVARVLHGFALVGFVLFGTGAGAGLPYYAGVALAVLLLAWEHSLVKPHDLSRLDAAFFTMNGVISMVVFLGTLGDRFW